MGRLQKIWKVLKSLLRNSASKDKILAMENETDPLKIVEILNEFFANIGPNLADKIAPSNLEINTKPYDAPLMFLQQTTSDEVTK